MFRFSHQQVRRIASDEREFFCLNLRSDYENSCCRNCWKAGKVTFEMVISVILYILWKSQVNPHFSKTSHPIPVVYTSESATISPWKFFCTVIYSYVILTLPSTKLAYIYTYPNNSLKLLDGAGGQPTHMPVIQTHEGI